MALTIERDVPLAPRTTLGIGGPARRLAHVTSVDELREALREAERASEPVLVLGGGSNVVIGDAGFAGLVIVMAIPGLALDWTADAADVTVGAGVEWDRFVEDMVECRLAGIECLSGIPGLVGATPIQNVGAYGQEVASTITRVRALDRSTGELVDLAPDACGFAYRTSVFKGNPRWIVTEVGFRLVRGEQSMPIRYAELARALGKTEGERAHLAVVRSHVYGLRRAKAMIVEARTPDSRSAGSFFTNPIVEPATLASLVAALPPDTQIPQWPQPDGRIKLSAGWLIERAGFTRGTQRGNVGLSTKHALALVNRGGATASELLAFAREIQDGVRARLGVELHPEPVIV